MEQLYPFFFFISLNVPVMIKSFTSDISFVNLFHKEIYLYILICISFRDITFASFVRIVKCGVSMTYFYDDHESQRSKKKKKKNLDASSRTPQGVPGRN